MFLERIEMTGFKSFADKTVIEFDRGLTAIVGPNGSGKSNLSEAIRWVLGEQSAKSLRGNRMEDVIFNGSQNRKPVNIAKVSLVLNNEDFFLPIEQKEVSISRTYNRKGDSQFFINNEAVRLKDITDLLLDTGLGKNSFSMISQGKVEAIFLSKPEERREIFEEAAGVQKYQLRKREAERKLTRSQDHLSRVRDILHELAGQLGPLKEQHDTALVYQEKAALLKTHEIALYTRQIEENRDAWQKAMADLKDQNRQLDDMLLQQADKTTALNLAQSELETVTQEIDDFLDSSQEQAKLIEQTRSQAKMLAQQIEFTHQSQSERQSSQADNEQAIVEFKAQLQTKEAESQELLEKKIQLKKATEVLENNLALLNKQTDLTVEELRDQLVELYRRESSAKNQLNQLSENVSQYDTRKKHHEEQLSALNQSIESLSNQVKDMSRKIDTDQEKFNDIEKTYLNNQSEINQLKQKRQAEDHHFYQNDHQLRQVWAKLNSLQEMQQEYSGYYPGVRAVMRQKDKIAGIEGTVADLIRVESHYQQAIDTALGGSLQNVVVTDDQAAKEAISYLRQTKAGRATFLPRSNIRGKKLRTDFLRTAQQTSGFIGLASDLIEFDPANQLIIDQLLGTTLVTQDTASAQNLSKALGQQVKIVSLQGDLILPGGSITGGQNKRQAQSMLARQEELAEQENLLAQLNEEKINLRSKLQQYEESIKRQEEIQHEYAGELNRQRDQLTQNQAELENKERKLQQLKNQSYLLIDDFQQFTDSYTESKNVIDEAENHLRTLEKEIVNLKNQISDQQLSESDCSRRLQELQADYNQSKTDLALAAMELKQVEDSRQQLLDRLKASQHAVKLHEEKQTLSEAELLSLKEKSEATDALLKEEEVKLVELNQAIEKLRHQRETLNSQVKEGQDASRQLEKVIQKIYQQQGKFEAQIEKYESLIDQQLNYLNETYHLSYEAASIEAKKVEVTEGSQQLVKQLRRDIEGLGVVNLSAIEDYLSLEERFTNLKEQETDLLTAMDHLMATISEMDKEVSSRFEEAYLQINTKFQETFTRLFGGGRAELQLTQPDNLLETGIDIIAQPPGKRRQNLALLSGGERALTAIALLFAILETKPAPFVVLDEVEAALDEANVYRYGEYIQHFTQKTQFIVITHRRGTMEYADVLYGVTMEQTGVSKLASVRLSEAQELTQ